MKDVFIYDAVRTPIGRYGGALSGVRADDLGALPIKALMGRNPKVDWQNIEELFYGCANQAGEDNRNVARMSGLLAGLPITVPGVTLNRLCGSGMDAVGTAARAIKSGEMSLAIAGGVESMSRAPLVINKAEKGFDRKMELFDTTMGWRFINVALKAEYGVDSMPETAENVAEAFSVSRADQDKFAYRSQQKTAAAVDEGRFENEIVSVSVKRGKQHLEFDTDEHFRRETSIDGLSELSAPFREGGSVTAGNASGINDGACALLLGDAEAQALYGLTPLAKVTAMATSGVEPRLMGIGPVSASRKALALAGLKIEQMDVIELNEAFAAQALAVLRELGVDDDDARVNPNGGAIALGHPLGMSGARLVTTAAYELQRRKGKYALCTMCIGVGQGIAIVLERL
ncbi:3-oxoadipyl-CoA thiolase [Shewanella woodyi]|uniref:3-oxoadipyl-CoA thiolase n=1 Tax=Shewanella woodyi (strain ATCC 51908 / MS32) TaxID=392500 RepID=B1KMB0_SHEWM|nr:3-oxoadipyl-CoA thiolase [Shewanella woodyi]ACA84523.1 beta-ketoadipyl CoA thiolase [Shewanella woodyi ATCC 51908]